MMVGRRCHVVAVFTVALVVGGIFGESALGQNAKDCTVDKTCTEDPKKIMTIEPKRALTTTTIDPKRAATTITIDPKKALTKTTVDPKRAATTTNPKKTGTTTTAKSTLKMSAAVTSTGSDSDGVLRHYNISGNDSDNSSADLKEIVVLDIPATADANKTVNGFENATISTPGAVKTDVNTTTETISSTNVTVASKTTVATPTNNSFAGNKTTTESTRVLQPNTGVPVVRFVDHVYCACDLIVSA